MQHRMLPSSLPLGGVQRSLMPVRRLKCTPVFAKRGKQANVKVNKRGKVTSRPGPGWQPAAEPMPQPVQQEQPQQQPQQQQASAAAAPSGSPAAATQQQQQPQQVQPQRGGQLTETPQVVVDRMFKRVITFAGAPVLTGILLFPLFWYLRVVQKIEYPIWVVYVTQALMFGGGLLGISYGILSTSWDPRREGSALGWTELQANLPLLLNRNKDQQSQ